MNRQTSEQNISNYKKKFHIICFLDWDEDGRIYRVPQIRHRAKHLQKNDVPLELPNMRNNPLTRKRKLIDICSLIYFFVGISK